MSAHSEVMDLWNALDAELKAADVVWGASQAQIRSIRSWAAAFMRKAVAHANTIDARAMVDATASPATPACGTISEDVARLHALLGPDWTPRQIKGSSWELRHNGRGGVWFAFSGFPSSDFRVPPAIADAMLDAVVAGHNGEARYSVSINKNLVKVEVL